MSKRVVFVLVFVGALFVAGVGQAAAACNGLTATITGTSGNDVIYGTSGADVIEALAGNDTIYASGANDTICAGDGYDDVSPGAGNDWIDGGVGGGVLNFTAAPAPMTVNLGSGSATGDGTDTFSNFGDVYGSTTYGDAITGNANSNYLVGWGGGDSLVGLGGGDYLQGLDGDDTLEGGVGNDTYDAGNGTDTAVYDDATGAVTVNLSTAGSQNTVNDGSDTLSAVENLVGSGYGDTLTGSSGANTISGLGGNDTVSGGSGADTLTGGAGADILHGEAGNDTLDLYDSANDSATASTCGADTDTVSKDVGDTTHATDCETVNYPGDTTAPTASLGGFTAVTGSSYQYVSGSTVWVNTTQTGSFSVDVTATDAQSGMQRVEYPALGTGWSPSAGNDTATPFTYVYTWSVAAASPGAQTAVARDNANNTTNVAFTVSGDASGPVGGSVAYLDGYTAGTSAAITFSAGTDAGSGNASHQLQRRSATLTGTSCGTYGSWSDIGAASPASPYNDATIADNTCYQYRLNATDRVGNVATTTGAGTVKVERTAPGTPSVSMNSGNTRIDGTAVISWTASTDSQSGIAYYEVKSWPDGAAEPSDSAFRSTGSSLAKANVRIGVNPTTAPWDWKFKVRAVDAAGNVSSSSSAFIIDDPSNQVTGTSGDQSSTDVGGAGLRVGHATGNLSISQTDVSTKGYGVDLVVSRTYNHQNIQFQPVIGDTGWNNSPGPGDNHSYTAQWAFGFHTHASFEQRLVSGDDGSDDGAADTLTFIDETGTNWPFTATAASAATFASPVGMDDWTLVKNPGSGDYPTCETGGVNSDYALRQKGGSTKCFDGKGRLLRETMRNGRSITYTRNGDGRVTEIAADDPDGGGSEQPLKLTLSYNGDKRVSKITDQLGRETRYDYYTPSGLYYLSKVEKYADSGSSTALTRTDYGWDSNTDRRIIDVDEWIYADDPGTGTSNDPLKHHWDIAYNGSNRVSTVTEEGTISRAVGSASETIPVVADTITTMNYVSLTTGGSAATMSLDVKTGTAADDDAFGIWTYTLDGFGRAITTEKPLEAGASVRADSTTAYTAEGRVASTESDRGDVTTYTYDGSGDTTQTTLDHATSGVPDTITKFEDFTPLGDAEKQTAMRSPDGSFLPKWPYALNECVDAGGSGTFKVTTAGTSGSSAPTWPGAGTVTSGTVVFTKQACTATPQGVTTLHEYDPNGNEIQATNPTGIRTCTYYTAFGEIDVQYKLDGTDCPGSPNTSARVKGTLLDHTYSAKGFLTQTVTDESTTKFTYDDAGQKTEERLVVDSGDSSKDVVTATLYDGAGRTVRTTTTDEGGTNHATSTGLNLAGLVTSTTVPNSTHPTGLNGGSPAGDVTSTRYDARGTAYLETRPDSTIITRRHDGRRRETYASVPHAATNSNPMATVITYFHSGAKKTKEDPAGITTTYDPSVTVPGADERPLKIDSPVSGETTFTYNANGEQATKTTSAGTFTYGYDGNGNKAKAVYPSGDVLIEVRDRRGNIVERRFTPNGGATEVTTMTYRADDKVLTEDQPSGGIDTTNTYSTSTGQLEKTELSDGGGFSQETRLSYDFAGRLESQTLENGASDLTTSYVYENKSGRTKRIEQPNGIDERYAYDEQGQVTELKAVKRSDSSWQGGDTYAYDTQGRITTRTRRESGTSYATTYTYDPAGQVTSETSPNGIVRGYVYRNANDEDSFGTDMKRQILYVNNAPAGTLSAARVDEIESCLTQTASCGAADEAAIDTAIADIAAPGAILDPAALTSTAADVARWLKLRNNRQSWTASTAYAAGTCIAPNGWQWERYKVTTAGTSGSSEPTWPASGTVSDGSVTWTKTNCTPVLVWRNYVYDSGSPSKHQLVRVDDSYGSATHFHYDARGNQDYRASSAYAGTPNQVWDSLERPIQVKDSSGASVTLVWRDDAHKLDSWSVGGTTRSLSYDADGRVVRMVATGSSSWSSEYDYLNGQLIAFKTGGAWYRLDRSKRGDIAGIRDSSGVLVASIRYSAYGEMWTDNQALVDKLGGGFGGRDGAFRIGDGLVWMGYRVLNVNDTRFISNDPMEARIGTTQSAYNYADGDPVNLLDPTGRGTLRIPTGGCNFEEHVYQTYISRAWTIVSKMSTLGCWGNASPTYASTCILKPSIYLKNCGQGSRNAVASWRPGVRPVTANFSFAYVVNASKVYTMTYPNITVR